MIRPLSEYNSIAFDCDGVLLNSNQIKSQAFYRIALPYGQELAQQLLDFHVANGGISRFLKFDHFWTNILGATRSESEIQSLIAAYGSLVRESLVNCECTSGLEALRFQTSTAKWAVVSGGMQIELREVFRTRNLDVLFDGGIYGSPSSKDDIFLQQLGMGNLLHPGLYFGDSFYDYFAAQRAGFDFVFISKWTEAADWSQFCIENNIPAIPLIKDWQKLWKPVRHKQFLEGPQR